MTVDAPGPPILTCRQDLLSEDAAGRSFVSVVVFAPNGNVAFVVPPWSPDGWMLPGGGINDGESDGDAAAREVFEEIGLHLHSTQAVAEIHNLRPDGGRHSVVKLMAGLVDGDRTGPGDVTRAAFFSDPPGNCLFGEDWTRQLLAHARATLATALNRRVWTEGAEHYADATCFSTRNVHYGPLIPGESRLRLLPPLAGKRVVDLGCGLGHNLMALRASGAGQGLGIDFIASNVAAARRNLDDPAFEVIEADLLKVDLAALGPFDVALSVFSLPFVSDPAALLANLGAAMRPGARVILAMDHPLRRGVWQGDHLRIDDWFQPSLSVRNWTVGEGRNRPFARFVHSLPDICDALDAGGFRIRRILEPLVENPDEAPYSGAYYLARLQEMRAVPYTIILVGERV